MRLAMSLAAAAALSTPERTLPKGRLLVGYATDRSLREDKVVAACRQGVNVVIWSFAHLEVEDDVPRVRPTFDVDMVRATQKRLEAEKLDVRHLVAFGGWNGPSAPASTSRHRRGAYLQEAIAAVSRRLHPAQAPRREAEWKRVVRGLARVERGARLCT